MDDSSRPAIDDPFDATPAWVQQSALKSEALLSGLFWGEVRTFLAVAKFGSMNRAAEYLGMRQDKVSRQMKRLQVVTGCQLLVQSRSGTRLTRRGEELAKLALKFDRELFAMTSDLRAETSQAEGTVRITITDGLGMVFMAPALRSFSMRYPRIEVHLKTPANFRDLRENQTDMMLGFREDNSQDVTCRRLGNLHLLPVASEAYIEQHGYPTRDSLREHVFVDSEQYAARNGAFDDWHALTGRGRIAHWSDTSLTYAMLVKNGLGIGLLGNYTMLEKSLLPLELGVHIPLRLYGVAMAERLQARPVRVAYDFLCSVFSPSNPWFAEQMNLDPAEPPLVEGAPLTFELAHST